jgi:hypothetical protein
LAAPVASPAQTDSVQRRFYRFFHHVKLDGAAARVRGRRSAGTWRQTLGLGRGSDDWEFGKTTINILMVSVIWNGMGIPLLWTLLPEAGNSNTLEGTGLLDRLRAVFPDVKIASLMGDREFIGDAWMAYLHEAKIPFMAARVAIRYNPVVNATYQRLVQRGRLKKVAIIACLRQLLTILNAMIRTKSEWQSA